MWRTSKYAVWSVVPDLSHNVPVCIPAAVQAVVEQLLSGKEEAIEDLEALKVRAGQGSAWPAA